MKKAINKSNASSKFADLKGAGIRSSYSSDMNAPDMISVQQRKSVAPATKRVNKRTDNTVERIEKRGDRKVARIGNKINKLEQKSQMASEKGKTAKASVLDSRKGIKSKKLEATKAKTKAKVNAAKKSGGDYAKVVQKKAETNARINTANRTGKFTPETLKMRRERRMQRVADGSPLATAASTIVGGVIKAVKKK
jgi:hypothetical protein